MRLDPVSDSSGFEMCGAAVKNARRANSVLILGTDSSGASGERKGQEQKQQAGSNRPSVNQSILSTKGSSNH